MVLEFSSFEWDAGNREKNLKKHGITCEETEEIFFSHPLVYPDEAHSTETEKRYILFGVTKRGHLLFTAFTLRGSKVRVISSRPMSQKERKWYEEEKKKEFL